MLKARKVAISSRPIRRRLNEAALNSTRTAEKPLLIREHKAAFCPKSSKLAGGRLEVLSTDETIVSSKFYDRRERVWRSEGKVFARRNIFQGSLLVEAQ